MQVGGQKIVVLGTGGTIAGLSRGPGQLGYRAAQKPVGDLLAELVAPAGLELLSEQVAQVDSKDMDLPVWQALLRRCRHWLAQQDVQGLIITHGTDTLEETAWLLQALLAPRKPVVLTCAMRPADAPDADGPGNLRDALAVTATPGAQGVVAVCAGRILGAQEVQKIHSTRPDAFGAGEAGDIGSVRQGQVALQRAWPAANLEMAACLPAVLAAAALPRVEIVLSHAAASAATLEALCDPELAQRLGAPPVRGLVLAGTGGGTLHQALEAGARHVQAAGIRVVRSTRCADGWPQPRTGEEFRAVSLSPVKARLALMLELLES